MAVFLFLKALDLRQSKRICALKYRAPFPGGLVWDGKMTVVLSWGVNMVAMTSPKRNGRESLELQC